MANYLELRSMCIFEPTTEELVQVTYLCELDAHVSEHELINICGGSIKDVGLANDKPFMLCGMFPLSVIYEKGGILKGKNSIKEFKKVEDNMYIPVNDGVGLICRMHYLSNLKTKKLSKKTA